MFFVCRFVCVCHCLCQLGDAKGEDRAPLIGAASAEPAQPERLKVFQVLCCLLGSFLFALFFVLLCARFDLVLRVLQKVLLTEGPNSRFATVEVKPLPTPPLRAGLCCVCVCVAQ